ncbi:MAG: IS630 family transposase [Actinobacteria bacterium]|nr:IS630 family transposase [Actinomycetota bacterium]MBI3686766.1 IS630 family transposase [Actinomycetota bacterium]
MRAVQLMEQGRSVEEITDILGVSRSSVFDWQRKYRVGGLAALSTKFASGRPTTLSEEQMTQLCSLLVGKDPRRYGLGFALWTRKLVGELIHQRFGHRLSPMTVGRILRKLGMSPQRPVYRATQADPEKVRAWTEVTYPTLRARATEAGASIFFADEAGVRTDHHAGATWAPVGRTPVVSATGDRQSVNMVSAVSPRGALHFQLVEGSMTAEVFTQYLTALLHDIPGIIFLVVDGSSAHTAKKTKDFVAATGGRLGLYFLPP